MRKIEQSLHILPVLFKLLVGKNKTRNTYSFAVFGWTYSQVVRVRAVETLSGILFRV
jgi:hypothetical protein